MQVKPDLEEERLAEVDFLDEIDNISCPELTTVLALCRTITDAPVAAITLIGAEELRFVACDGFDGKPFTREHSVCSRVLLSDESLIIPDLQTDSRFANLNVTINNRPARTYFGVPLVKRPGIALGTLYVCYTDVRALSAELVASVKQLAFIVLTVMCNFKQGKQLNLAYEALQEHQQQLTTKRKRFKQIERQAKVGGFDMDLNTGKISWTDEVYRITHWNTDGSGKYTSVLCPRRTPTSC